MPIVHVNIYINLNNGLLLNSYFKNKFMYSVDIGPIAGGGQCWVNVIDGGPALARRWGLLSCLLVTRVFLVQKE